MRLVFLLLVVGCNNGGSGGVAVHAEGATFVVAQDGDGPWQQVALDATGTGRFESSAGFYGVARFCPDLGFGGKRGAEVVLDTEVRAVELACSVTQTAKVRLTGTTAPDAEVSIGQSTAVVDATGAYDISVTPGRYDVVAVLRGTPPKVLVERDVEIGADRVLDLPVATAGVELLAMTPTVA